MRTKLLKMMVFLFLAGSGHARPQKTDESTQPILTESNDEGWKAVPGSRTAHDVEKDSRYTWNSGSNRIPYINYYHDSTNSFSERTTEVSFGFEESKIAKTKVVPRRSEVGGLRTVFKFGGSDSSRLTGQNLSGQFIGDIVGNAREAESEGGVVVGFDAEDISQKLKLSDKKMEGSSVKGEIVGSSRVFYSGKDFVGRKRPDDFNRNASLSSFLTKSELKSNFGHTSDRSLRSRQPRFGNRTVSVGFAEGDALKNSDNVRDKPSGRKDEKWSNNSRPTVPLALNQLNSKSKFVDRKRIFSRRFNETATRVKNSGKVEQGDRFDQVEAMRRIANVLQEERNTIPPSVLQHFRHPDLHWNQQRSNETKLPRDSNTQKFASHDVSGRKKFRVPIKLVHSKNWPNENLQDVADLYNYEKYTSSEEVANQDSGLVDDRRKPVTSIKDSSVDHGTPSDMEEIIQWIKIPAFATNHSHFVEKEEVDAPISVVFDPVYQNLEPNRPLNSNDWQTPIIEPNRPQHNFESSESNYAQHNFHSQESNYPQNNFDSSESNYPPLNFHSPESYYPPHNFDSSESNYPPHNFDSSESNYPAYASPVLLKNKTVYGPVTRITQNTVVQLLNTNVKGSNVTRIQSKVPGATDKLISSQGPFSPSNSLSPSSHLVSSSSQDSTPSPSSGAPAAPNVHISFTSDEEQNKDSSVKESQVPLVSYGASCPTILINSYTKVNNTIQSKEGCTDLNIIINSHVFSSNTFKSSTVPPTSNDQSNDDDENEKYVNGAHEDLDPSATYQSLDSPSSSSGSSQWPQNTYSGPSKDPAEGVYQENVVTPDVSSLEVFQGTQISISGSNPQFDESGLSDDFEMAQGSPPLGNDESVNAADPATSGISASGGNDDPTSGSINPPVSTGVAESPLSSSGSVMGQANDASSSLQLPGLPNIPNTVSGLSNLPSSLVSQGSSPSGAPSTSLSSTDDDDDDEDDDYDFGLSPSAMVGSIASVFAYFTFLNPLNYGFLSLAAAPFAALAAGVLGVSAFLFPWAFPSVFDFGRASDKVTIRFRPNIEEVVRQSVYKYGRLNEWKSKRKKRKR